MQRKSKQGDVGQGVGQPVEKKICWGRSRCGQGL